MIATKVEPMAVPHRTVVPPRRATIVEGRVVFPTVDRTADGLRAVRQAFAQRFSLPAVRRVE